MRVFCWEVAVTC